MVGGKVKKGTRKRGGNEGMDGGGNGGNEDRRTKIPTSELEERKEITEAKSEKGRR